MLEHELGLLSVQQLLIKAIRSFPLAHGMQTQGHLHNQYRDSIQARSNIKMLYREVRHLIDNTP
jgi:hypothetical protein